MREFHVVELAWSSGRNAMNAIKWHDNYSVGVASLDAQHKILIRLINRLHDIEREGGDLSSVLERLDWYVRNHFSFEEALLRAADYEEYNAHIKEHRDFEDWLKSIRRVGGGGLEIRELSRSINAHLKNWLTKHILVVDMDYKSVLTAQGNNSATITGLTDELIKVLENARGGDPAAIDIAVAIAGDIKMCASDQET